MHRSKSTSQSNHLIVLIAGDLLVLLLFVMIGRRSPSMLTIDVKAFLSTAIPFFIGWFAVTPWFGLFSADVSQNWRKLVPRLLIAWAIGGPLALILRAWLLGRAIPGGIPISFVAAGLGFSTLFMLAWRLGFSWWCSRLGNQTQKPPGVSL